MEFTNSTILTYVKSCDFAIPATCQERNVAAKFQPDWPSGLAGEVEIGDGRTDGQSTTTIPYLECKFQIS